jgi:hypothetical protein
MKTATDTLDVKLVIEKNDRLEKCIKHTLSSWISRPSLAMVETLCTGCRLGIIRGTINFAKKNKIPITIDGATPFEYPYYRNNMMKFIKNGGKFSAMLGYASQIVKNPKWLTNFTYLDTQIKEYFYYYHSAKIENTTNLLRVYPFMAYIRWTEKDIISTIENELHWAKNPDSESTWKSDCNMALLKWHIYKTLLGFNDKVDGLSHLIRDNQLSREEALERLRKDNKNTEEAIQVLFDRFGLNHSDFKIALNKLVESRRKNA